MHTWIAAKPSGAKSYTVYEVIGWRLRWGNSPVAIHQRAPDARWFGNAPELLFDLARDPDEQTDLSTDPAHAAIKTQLKDRLLGRYDVEAMTRRAAKEKETRSFLHDALSTNGGYHWDYQPLFDASRQYVRGVNKPATV